MRSVIDVIEEAVSCFTAPGSPFVPGGGGGGLRALAL